MDPLYRVIVVVMLIGLGIILKRFLNSHSERKASESCRKGNESVWFSNGDIYCMYYYKGYHFHKVNKEKLQKLVVRKLHLKNGVVNELYFHYRFGYKIGRVSIYNEDELIGILEKIRKLIPGIYIDEYDTEGLWN